MNSTQKIWKLLDKDLSIQKNIGRDLINIRALAKYLIKEYNVKASLDSVISAIRRYESDTKWLKEDKKIRNLFKNALIRTRNNIICFTFRKPIGKYVTELYNRVGPRSKFVKTITGTDDAKVIVEEMDSKFVDKYFPKDKLLHTNTGLSEISIAVSHKAIQTKGVLARIANEVAINNINIEDVIVCPPEFIIYVKKEDTIQTHQSLLQLNGL